MDFLMVLVPYIVLLIDSLVEDEDFSIKESPVVSEASAESTDDVLHFQALVLAAEMFYQYENAETMADKDYWRRFLRF